MTISSTRKLVGVTLAAGLIVALAGCGAAPEATTPTNGGKTAVAGFKPCIVSDDGGWNDKSFNESAKNGIDKASQELGVKSLELESSAESDYAPNLENAVSQNCTLIISVGSGGSIAGLLAGFLFDFEGDGDESPLDIELIGVSVSRPPEALMDDIATKAQACGQDRPRLANLRCRWELVDGRRGGFNQYDADEAAFIDELMRRSGLLIDTTYNGKALRWLYEQPPKDDRPILYWHTGGALAAADRLANPRQPVSDLQETT